MARELELENPNPSSEPVPSSKPKKLTLIPLVFIIYFEVCGGPYGAEPAVRAAGPLLALIGFISIPFLCSIPEALVTAELSTAFQGNGGFVIWTARAFGPFAGALTGFWKFLSSAINAATFPALCADYLAQAFPRLTAGAPRSLMITLFVLFLSLVNLTGVAIVGYVAVAIGVATLLPFGIMAAAAAPLVKPARWGVVGRKRDWRLYLNVLFWNMNYWDNVSTMAGEVERPQRTFPRAMLAAVILTIVSYVVPLLAAVGAVDAPPEKWINGFFADSASMIAGTWLKIWVEAGAVLSAVGLYEAQLSSNSFQLLGMAQLGLLPCALADRSRRFHTPWLAILVSTLLTLAISFLAFGDIVASANFLFSLGMLAELAAFVRLRTKLPGLQRPFRVPLGTAAAAAMCAVPTVILLFLMAIASWRVWVISATLTAVAVGVYFLMGFCRIRGVMEFSRREEEDDGGSEGEEEK